MAAVSGGLLAVIWGGVWYAAITSGRLGAAPSARTASQALFFGGLLTAAAGFLYLRTRRLSVVDGTPTELLPVMPPPDAETKVDQPLPAERVRV